MTQIQVCGWGIALSNIDDEKKALLV